jgi:hypothetical protein
MKNFLRKYWLHISCVIIWAAVAILCYSGYKTYNELYKQVEPRGLRQPQAFVKNEKVIDYNTIYVEITNVETPKEKTMSKDEIVRTIYEATRTWDSYNTFQYIDAVNLYYLITAAASNHCLNQKLGFMIAHIESDFRANAISDAGAVGLCQIMKCCLNEYNDNHKVKYTIQDMLDPEKNLEVGFWYYARILNHYDNFYGYITRTSLQTELRDAYIAYNYGVTRFSQIGRWGRDELRAGRYPENIYGSQIGDPYNPILRLNDISQIYF